MPTQVELEQSTFFQNKYAQQLAVFFNDFATKNESFLRHADCASSCCAKRFEIKCSKKISKNVRTASSVPPHKPIKKLHC